MRNNPTLAERRLWNEYLRIHPFKFTRQKPIGNFIVDFYCSKLKLIIEIDGETHLSKKDRIRDGKRTEYFNKFGIKVIRFWNDEILDGLETVCEIIEDEIKNNPLNPPCQGD